MIVGNKAYLGIPDRIIVWLGGRWVIRYAGFFDHDGEFPWRTDFRSFFRHLNRNILVLRSGRGYHIIALSFTGFNGKLAWHKRCEEFFGPCDYQPRRTNYLRVSRKNGEIPTFSYYSPYNRSEAVSSFHLSIYRRVIGQAWRGLSSYFVPIPSIGHWRFYASDPRGLFDNVAGLK